MLFVETCLSSFTCLAVGCSLVLGGWSSRSDSHQQVIGD